MIEIDFDFRGNDFPKNDFRRYHAQFSANPSCGPLLLLRNFCFCDSFGQGRAGWKINPAQTPQPKKRTHQLKTPWR